MRGVRHSVPDRVSVPDRCSDRACRPCLCPGYVPVPTRPPDRVSVAALSVGNPTLSRLSVPALCPGSLFRLSVPALCPGSVAALSVGNPTKP